jgi:DNA-binding CsgD family transcriptional regulator
MARLTRSDMEAALAFAAEVGTAASKPERADAWMLEAIATMLASERAAYDQVDATSCLLMHDAAFPERPANATSHEWDLLGVCNPFTQFATRNRDPYFRAHRLTDVAPGPFGVARADALERVLPHGVQTRLPGASGSHWTLELERSGSNYSDRELLLLDAIRPALLMYESHRVLMDAIAGLRDLHPAALPDGSLSVRENEVLDLVAGGASNAQIAERLWISPATVKKHLENIYAKLEVGSRTAALAHTGRSVSSGTQGQPPT